MKQLITYLLLLFCIYANSQSDKVNALENQSDEVKKEWRKHIDAELRELQYLRIEVRKLKSEISALKKDIANLKDRKDLTALIKGLGIKVLKPEDLPKTLRADELGVAFVASEDKSVSLALFINNQWKIISL